MTRTRCTVTGNTSNSVRATYDYIKNSRPGKSETISFHGADFKFWEPFTAHHSRTQAEHIQISPDELEGIPPLKKKENGEWNLEPLKNHPAILDLDKKSQKAADFFSRKGFQVARSIHVDLKRITAEGILMKGAVHPHLCINRLSKRTGKLMKEEFSPSKLNNFFRGVKEMFGDVMPPEKSQRKDKTRPDRVTTGKKISWEKFREYDRFRTNWHKEPDPLRAQIQILGKQIEREFIDLKAYKAELAEMFQSFKQAHDAQPAPTRKHQPVILPQENNETGGHHAIPAVAGGILDGEDMQQIAEMGFAIWRMIHAQAWQIEMLDGITKRSEVAPEQNKTSRRNDAEPITRRELPPEIIAALNATSQIRANIERLKMERQELYDQQRFNAANRQRKAYGGKMIITAVLRREGKIRAAKKFIIEDEITLRAHMKTICRLNSELGYDVYAGFHDDSKKRVIVLDDVNAATIRKIKQDIGDDVMTIRTSPKNHTVMIQCDREITIEERRRAVSYWGGDMACNVASTRLAGTRNVKRTTYTPTGELNEDGEEIIKTAAPIVTMSAPTQPKIFSADSILALCPEPVKEPEKTPEPEKPQQPVSTKKESEVMKTRKDFRIGDDESQNDFRYAMYLINHGVNVEETIRRLMDESPQRGKAPSYYSRTVRKVLEIRDKNKRRFPSRSRTPSRTF